MEILIIINDKVCSIFCVFKGKVNVLFFFLSYFICMCAVTGSVSCRRYSVLPPPRDEEEKAMLDSMLRVDHAGEYGANRIYAGQMAVLGRTQTGPLIQVLNISL